MHALSLNATTPERQRIIQEFGPMYVDGSLSGGDFYKAFEANDPSSLVNQLKQAQLEEAQAGIREKNAETQAIPVREQIEREKGARDYYDPATGSIVRLPLGEAPRPGLLPASAATAEVAANRPKAVLAYGPHGEERRFDLKPGEALPSGWVTKAPAEVKPKQIMGYDPATGAAKLFALKPGEALPSGWTTTAPALAKPVTPEIALANRSKLVRQYGKLDPPPKGFLAFLTGRGPSSDAINAYEAKLESYMQQQGFDPHGYPLNSAAAAYKDAYSRAAAGAGAGG